MAENAGGEVTTFTWDLASPLAQVLATSDGAAYVHGLDLVAERRSGAWAYPLGDALGSVRQWTDEDGYVDYAGAYTPFGTQMWTGGSTSSNWGYTGEWWDSRAELLYLRARWLDGSMGRFTQVDPMLVEDPDLRQPQSLNLYAFVLNQPLSYTDPTGMQPVHSIRNPPALTPAQRAGVARDIAYLRGIGYLPPAGHTGLRMESAGHSTSSILRGGASGTSGASRSSRTSLT